jgi:general secretion pathway protein G
MMMRLGRRRRGGGLAPAYTLTEMLVVLVIIGLLSAIVGPRLFSRLDDAKRRTARLQLVSLQTSVDLFRLDLGRLPTAEEGLTVLVQPPAGEEATWLGPYLARDAIPLDPWGQAYAYQAPPEGSGAYQIVSLGADRAEGGSGAAADIVVSAGGSTPPPQASD